MPGLSNTHNTLQILITINEDLEVVKLDGKNLIRKVATKNAGYHIKTTKFEVQTKPRVCAKSWWPSHLESTSPHTFSSAKQGQALSVLVKTFEFVQGE